MAIESGPPDTHQFTNIRYKYLISRILQALPMPHKFYFGLSTMASHLYDQHRIRLGDSRHLILVETH